MTGIRWIMKNLIFNTILIAALFMGIYACWPVQKEQVKLLTVEQIQTELVSRGHDIKIDGKFGSETDLALTIELTK